MSKVSQQLHLMGYVKTKIRFNFRVGVVCLAAFILLLGLVSLKYQFSLYKGQQELVTLSKQVSIHEQKVQKLMYRGDKGNYLLGILPGNLALNNARFYLESQALADISVDDLWIVHFFVGQNGDSIKIEGGTLDSKQVNAFLKNLDKEKAFDKVVFKGVDVQKGVLPKIPPNQSAAAKKLKIPPFYQFDVQTVSATERRKDWKK